MVLVLLAAVALVAYACQGSNSPTAPVADTGPTLTPVSGAAHDEAVRLWATLMHHPEIVWDNDVAWVRLTVECSHSENGPASMAVFRCEGALLDRCAGLAQFQDFQALASYAGLDGRDQCPLWHVVRLRTWD